MAIKGGNTPNQKDVNQASSTQDPQLEVPVNGYNKVENPQQPHANAMHEAFAAGDPNQSNYNQFSNGKRFDWLRMGSLAGYTVNSSPASISLTQIVNAFKEFWDDNLAPELEIDMIPVDKSSIYGLGISILIFAVRDSNKQDSPVAHHTLILEGSIEGIPPRYDQVDGRQVEVLQLASDTYDQDMRKIIAAAVRRQYPKASAILTADAEVINRGFDLTDQLNIRNLTVNAVSACRQQLALAKEDFTDLNLAYANPNSANLTQINTFSRAVVETDLGSHPVRSDITMTMIANPINNDNRLIQESSVITRATGFIDLLYLNNAPSAGQWGFGQQQHQPPVGYGFPPPTPVFQPQLVLTQLINTQIQTLPGILLALVNAYSIFENQAWLPALLPKPGEKDPMHDIGNIGYDVAAGQDPTKFEKINTSPAEFGFTELNLLKYRFFHKGLALALDVPECGSSTWAYQTLAAAAYGGHEQPMQHLRDAANILTNGLFEQCYRQLNGTGQLVYTNFNRIFMGYYEAKDGKRDIRDFDYLAAAGMMGKKDRSELATYTDTYNANYKWQDRLHTRRMMIETYLKNVTFTNYALRVSFKADFIQALVQATAMNGYRVTPQQPYMSDVNYQRANAGYITGAVLDDFSSGIFTSSSGYTSNGGYGGGRFASMY